MKLGFLLFPLLLPCAVATTVGMSLVWPLVWLRPVYQFWVSLWLEGWFASTTAAWMFAHGSPVRLFLDSPAEKKAKEPSAVLTQDPSAIVITMNHRTRFDWMYLWFILPAICAQAVSDFAGVARPWFPFGMTSRIVIVLKKEIGSIPLMGWGTAMCSFLFLERDWERDGPYLRRRVAELVKEGSRPIFLVFPEGTDLSSKNLGKSREFAESRDLAARHCTLFPRRRGTHAIIASIFEALAAEGVTAPRVPVLDVTVAYADAVPQTEKELIAGVVPSSVDVWLSRRELVAAGAAGPAEPFRALCRTDGASSGLVEATEEGVGAWLEDSFLWREATLRQWHADRGAKPAERTPGAAPDDGSVESLAEVDPRCVAWAAQQRARRAVVAPVPPLSVWPATAFNCTSLVAIVWLSATSPAAALLGLVVFLGVNVAVMRTGGWDNVRDVCWRGGPWKRPAAKARAPGAAPAARG
ncbi:hypothetical protein FNF29_05832 [Cafeteria roenbergensis]|uniref:Phospholipid/glycerol acyltransferase domain-containing protein n=1 Tax=Cafeteria roenbergensis TaxID=33653 RepID=A0A5A8CC67_CAFRO|nr:hypothetical protein FNF29_05832 [Cafeteria roenbergensis]|eukprot:KAA0149620.1 hypothetical protein FNF29_05832 [Cafeteria roenbergensis]